jgi:hypothetical protein
MELTEVGFQQDLNGDGHIGIVSVIESSGSTKLDLFANNYFLDPATGAGPSLKYNGVAVVSGQFGTWAPIASEQTATGFDVAWKDSATGNFRVWTTDSTGTTRPRFSIMSRDRTRTLRRWRRPSMRI